MAYGSVLRVRSALCFANFTPTPKKVAVEKYRGRKISLSKYDDNHVLEARRLYEQVGLPPRKIKDFFEERSIKVTASAISQWLSYTSRGHLNLKPNANSYI